MKKIILASKSLDRREILNRLKIPFEILVTNVDEAKYMKEINEPIELIKILARAKASKAKNLLTKSEEETIIIAADTVVVINGKIIGKAKNEQEAYEILKKLSGKTHMLMTGIAVTSSSIDKIVVDFDKTDVKFLTLSEEEIWSYIKTGEWKGRAGAYSIMDKASIFIETINGSPSNVIGLPIQKIFMILKKEFDLNLLEH